MKNNYCNRVFIVLLVLSFMGFQNSRAQVDTLYINATFKSANLKHFSQFNKPDGTINLTDGRNYFYFGFKNKSNSLLFILKNTENKSTNVVLELSNTLINEIDFFKIKNNVPTRVYKTGIDFPVSSKPIEHRLFSLPISLEANEVASFRLNLIKEKGKPLVTSAFIKSENTFAKHSYFQQFAIGSYYGISLLSVFFSLFIFYFLRNRTYLIYGAYIIFLGLFIGSYTGVFSQLFLNSDTIFNKYTHYVLFSEISLLLFVVFSQKFLEAKIYMPTLKKAIDILLVILIIIRLLLHYLFTNLFENYVSVFMNIWYAIFLMLVVLILIEIRIYYKNNTYRTSLFTMAYLFMILGTFITILYHSYGLVNTNFYGLPILFYSSFLEIIFLTFTLVFMVKDIYDERNILSEKIVIQEKKNLTAFIKGEDQERHRISKELHDNIGSKLSYLRRFVSDKFKDDDVTKTIDVICNDVRNLSHDISPSDLKIVGFESAVEDLSKNISTQTTINVDFNSYNFPETLHDNTAIQLYRVIQETFNNIIKHANAKNIDVQLMGHDNSISISIEDDGIGFYSNHEEKGIGLKNMTSRIDQIGGTISIDSQINKGTSVLITLPY